jgi:adenylate cyclase
MSANVPVAASEVVSGLRALLLARGVDDEEFDAALAEHRLDLLVVDKLLMPHSPARSSNEVIESTGMPEELALRLWRALGFPENSGRSFNDSDIAALRTLEGLAEIGVTGPETAIQVTRVLGSSMARLADALVSASDSTAAYGGRPDWVETDEDESLWQAEMLAFTSEVVFPSVEELLLYAWRRHIQAATRRRSSMRREGRIDGPMVTELTVGFADMVGFTALSSQLTAGALADVVDRFEEIAHSTVVEGGGRVVKMIGDEVMFVATEALTAVRIALDLVDAYADDDLLSDVRVGLSTGPVLMREGDFFGTVVNRASRIVNIADAGTVLVNEEIHEVLAAPAGSDNAAAGSEFAWEPLKPRDLKDIGRVALWSVSRAGTASAPDARRTGVRWRRLGGLGLELEALRLRGELAVGSIVGSRAAPVPSDDEA